MSTFHVLMVVWGDSFIDSMVRLTIPTLLYSGNLPALCARHTCKFVICTRGEEERRIRNEPAVARLAALMPVEFVLFDPALAGETYKAMSDAHHRACLDARREGAKVIFASPDGICADGSLAKVREYAEMGKAAVVCPGPRLTEETLVPALLPRIETRPVTRRELVSLMRQHLHPQLKRNFVTSYNFATFPTFLFWSLGAKGLLMRGLHLHPLMIDFARVDGLETLAETTMDTILLGRGIANWSDIHVETDSDNIFVCSHTPRSTTYSVENFERFHVERFHHVSSGPLFNGLNRIFFSKALKLHAGDLDEEWERVERETAWLADLIQHEPPPPRPIPAPPPWTIARHKLMDGLQGWRARITGQQY